jgi:hypothetical protein
MSTDTLENRYSEEVLQAQIQYDYKGLQNKAIYPEVISAFSYGESLDIPVRRKIGYLLEPFNPTDHVQKSDLHSCFGSGFKAWIDPRWNLIELVPGSTLAYYNKHYPDYPLPELTSIWMYGHSYQVGTGLKDPEPFSVKPLPISYRLRRLLQLH